MTFKRGDIVRVIGLDGPAMKLGRIHASVAEVFWFSDGVLMDSSFDLDVIELVATTIFTDARDVLEKMDDRRAIERVERQAQGNSAMFAAMRSIGNASWEPPDGWKGRETEPTTATVKGGPSTPMAEALTKARADADRLRAMMGDMSIALNDCLNAFRKRCGQGYMEELITRIEFLLSRGIPS
jgi:hypothetical protein